MASNVQFNMRCPAVKRLMREALEMKDPTEECSATPVDDNLFEWHFTIRGAQGTEFEGGIYHGCISFPSEYPMKPPNIMLLTPNGRFETNKKICLSISGYHPETWLPSWCVRTALIALIAFMPTKGEGSFGSLDYPKEERQQLANASRRWKCSSCGSISNLLLPVSSNNGSNSSNTSTVEEGASQNEKQLQKSSTQVENDREKEQQRAIDDETPAVAECKSNVTDDASASTSVSTSVHLNNDDDCSLMEECFDTSEKNADKEPTSVQAAGCDASNDCSTNSATITATVSTPLGPLEPVKTSNVQTEQPAGQQYSKCGKNDSHLSASSLSLPGGSSTAATAHSSSQSPVTAAPPSTSRTSLDEIPNRRAIYWDLIYGMSDSLVAISVIVLMIAFLCYRRFVLFGINE